MASATEIAERAQKALARFKTTATAAKANASHVAGVGGHELLGHVVLATASATTGYLGQEKVRPWGIELRVVPGLIGQLGGLGAMLFGMPSGRFAVTIGRGLIGSWLAERAFVAGAKMAVPAEQRKALPQDWTTKIGGDATPGASDVVLTRTRRF